MADGQLSYVALAIAVLASLGGAASWLSHPRAKRAVAPKSTQAGDADEDEPSGPWPRFRLSAAGCTDLGLARTSNEDAFALEDDHALFVVADGMGKHAAGEVASQLAVASVLDAFRLGAAPRQALVPPRSRRAAELGRALLLANERVYSRAQQVDAYAGMGTTLVAARFEPRSRRVYVAHVGDSRCYRFREGAVTQLTRDHTLEEQPVHGRRRTLLSRAIGVRPSVEVDVTTDEPQPGDAYLLCSDGLSRALGDDVLAEALGARGPLDACLARLVDGAKAAGGRDNITAIVIRIEALAERHSKAPPPPPVAVPQG